MNQFINTIRRFPFQTWVFFSNLGTFTWLQLHTNSLVKNGENLITSNRSTINFIWIYLRDNPWIFLVLAVLFIILFKFLKRAGHIIFTALNCLFILKILGLI